MTELTITDRNRLAASCRKSLYFLCRYVLGMKDLNPRIHGPYCAMLQSPHRYKQAWLPRGWFKTSIGAEGWPIWLAVRNSMITIGIASNVVENSEKMVGQIMWHFEQNELFGSLFPELIPNFKRDWGKRAACVNRPRNVKEATFEAIGIGGTGTTRHYHVLIEEDLLYPKKDELTGDEIRPGQQNIETAIGFHKMSYNLWRDRRTGIKLVQGTVMSLHDLFHYIQKNESQYQDATYIRRMIENGEPSWPERYGWPEIEQAKKDLGPYLFNTQMLMEAVALEDMLFQEEWITGGEGGPRYWRRSSGILEKNPSIYVLVDPAVGEGRQHDYSAIVVVAVTPDDHRWVLSARRGKWNPERLVNAIFDEIAKWPRPKLVGIECMGGFRAIMFLFAREMQVRGESYRLLEMKPGHGRSKGQRIEAMQPLFSAGKIHLGVGMAELRDELLAYPCSKHEDLIDALAYHVDVVSPPKITVVKPKLHPNSYEAINQEIEDRAKLPVSAFPLQDRYYGGEEIETVDDYFENAVALRGGAN